MKYQFTIEVTADMIHVLHLTALDWKLFDKKPSILQMKRDAEEFLYHVLNVDNCISYGSGGFMAYRYEDSISLAFIVETVTTYFDED